MKILLFVASLYGGGMERVAAHLASHLVKKHQVTVAVFSNGAKTYPIDPKVDIVNIGPKSPIRLLHGWEKYTNIRKTIIATDPDIIISFSASLNYKVLKVNRRLKKKIIVSDRNTISLKLSRQGDYARKKLYPEADYVVYVSKEDCDKTTHVTKKTCIYNPLSFELYDSYSDREKSVVAIGSQQRWHRKGFDMLIEAWKNVAQNHPDWCLEFLGTDSPSPIHELVDKYHLEKKVRFLGRSDDMQGMLRRKSVYVLASRFEGCPNSLIEAMSQGCACVAFNCQTGPKEIITDGVSGLLVENGSVDDLTRKLDALLSDEQRRISLSKNAVEEVKRFNPETIMKQWDELIEKVCDKNE